MSVLTAASPPDQMGMGDSHKLPASGPASCAFAEYRRYLDALLDTLEVPAEVGGGGVALPRVQWPANRGGPIHQQRDRVIDVAAE